MLQNAASRAGRFARQWDAGTPSNVGAARDPEPFFSRVIWRVILGVAIVISTYWIAGFYLWPDAGNLFLDAHIYYQATATWLDGGNPWTTTYRGVPFAGIPPTLLLNVPLVPFGEQIAVAIWAVANTLAVIFIISRLRLPAWTLFLLPIVEGWLGASPDLALAALLLAGGGWIAALTKPYSAPVLVADRRWRQIAVAVVVGVITIPFLPWGLFYESRDLIAQTFARFAGYPLSASGNMVLLGLVALALISLGWRRGFILFTPGLVAQQPHYIVFSMEAVRWSRLLALAFTVPLPHAAAVGIVLYAVIDRLPSRDPPLEEVPLRPGDPRDIPIEVNQR